MHRCMGGGGGGSRGMIFPRDLKVTIPPDGDTGPFISAHLAPIRGMNWDNDALGASLDSGSRGTLEQQLVWL